MKKTMLILIVLLIINSLGLFCCIVHMRDNLNPSFGKEPDQNLLPEVEELTVDKPIEVPLPWIHPMISDSKMAAKIGGNLIDKMKGVGWLQIGNTTVTYDSNHQYYRVEKVYVYPYSTGGILYLDANTGKVLIAWLYDDTTLLHRDTVSN